MTRSPRILTAFVARFAAFFVIALASTPPANAAAPQPGPPLTIVRSNGPISIDGDLTDPGWQGVTPITQWFETNPGDNVEPKVANVAYLAYDDKYLYAGFQFADPEPSRIRAPIGDHDNTPSSTDYAGVIVDSRNDAKTARMFLANANGVQYDAITSDVTGEDNSPDFYWDAQGRITESGWNLEMRIPFSSLRYANADNPTWGMLLYRNYPRDRRYQYFTARLPRDVSCFICNSSKMTGLGRLPIGSNLVIAPYGTLARNDAPRDELGSPLESGDAKNEAGLDVKWSPFADVTLDGTYNPDFSQVESDAAQIGANERFALFFSEKRSFFLEGVDLLATPFQAVYTRTITAPQAGLRATGRIGTTVFTALATHDEGGGLVILPGAQGSDFAEQDFHSDVAIFRVRRDLGQSFVSMLGTTREVEDGGYNRVFGPDFQWRPNTTDAVTGQALWSISHTPDRSDLATEWDGRSLQDRALLLRYEHYTRNMDLFVQGQDLGEEFRADDGFIPQVGYREVYLETGMTKRPKDAFLSRLRLFGITWYDADYDGNRLASRVSVGVGMDGRLNSFTRIELNRDDFRVGDEILQRFRPRVQLQVNPGRVLNAVSLDTYFGDEVDFANGREGSGVSTTASVTVRPNEHLELRNDASGRWLHVKDGGRSGRLFSAGVERLRATYAFNSRSFLRLIGQYVRTTRDPSLYTFEVARKDADLGASALFAYKLNFQTVLYLGYGDDRTFTDVTGKLERSGQHMFGKISYAWQR